LSRNGQPFGVVLSKATLDAIYSDLPEGLSVLEVEVVRAEDGALYRVSEPALVELTEQSVSGEKAARSSALAKLTPEERKALGLEREK